jgi:copper chaperone
MPRAKDFSLDLPAVEGPSFGQSKEIEMTEFNLPDMSCGHCKATVETTIKALDPGANLRFDMERRTVAVESRADAAAIGAALAKAGYPASAA